MRNRVPDEETGGDETLDPSALLDGDGNVDTRQVKSHAQRQSTDRGSIAADECDEMRKMAARDDVGRVKAVAETFGVNRDTARRHISGGCHCPAEREPEPSILGNTVSERECLRMRAVVQHVVPEGIHDIEGRFAYSAWTIREHITDRCSHDVDAPTIEYDGSAWVAEGRPNPASIPSEPAATCPECDSDVFVDRRGVEDDDAYVCHLCDRTFRSVHEVRDR